MPLRILYTNKLRCDWLTSGVVILSSYSILSRFGHVNVGSYIPMSLKLWSYDLDDFSTLDEFVDVIVCLHGMAYQTFTSKVILFMIWLCFWIPFCKRVFFLISAFPQTSLGRSSQFHRLNYGSFMHYGMSHVKISHMQLLHSRNQNAQNQAHV